MVGIQSYGTYLPRFRLDRAAISSALGTTGGKGTRAVASHDEDSVSLGVEAARQVVEESTQIDRVLFVTASPPYAEKTNATIVHAALGLSTAASAYDMVGSVRSGIAAVQSAIDGAYRGRRTLVVSADVRSGLPGSADESQGGDAASALVIGPGSGVAEIIGTASSSAEFLDRWRLPGELEAHTWEERFGEEVYLPLAVQAVTDVLAGARVGINEVAHIVVSGLNARANKKLGARLEVRPEKLAPDLASTVGNSGCAHQGLLLAGVLEQALPGELILLISLADGADALLLKATAALPAYRARRPARPVRPLNVSYADFLTWRGVLRRQPPRRPDPNPPAPPAAARAAEWKFGFSGSQCTLCGYRHLPPSRKCQSCGAIDHMTPQPVAHIPARIAAFTIDRLTYSLNPPVVLAIVDFDGGGRFQCEMTDVDPQTIAVGDRVEMTFRRLNTARSIHNYFWKVRPLDAATSGEED
jgi:hydroxymethylglutaryl-CoA synthase